MGKKDKKKKEKFKDRITKTKWESLEARGYSPPANNEERMRRLKEAHGE